MGAKLFMVALLIVVSVMVMILHELPKAIVFRKRSKDSKYSNKDIFRLHKYIDPIGLILCVTSCAGFSKPYMYRIKDKKTNLLLGVTGLVSLFSMFVFSIILLRTIYFPVYSATSVAGFDYLSQVLPTNFWYYFALISLCMFFVNLFPVSVFDVGLIIAGKSPAKYFTIIGKDHLIKGILLVAIIFSVVQQISMVIINYILQ